MSDYCLFNSFLQIFARYKSVMGKFFLLTFLLKTKSNESNVKSYLDCSTCLHRAESSG